MKFKIFCISILRETYYSNLYLPIFPLSFSPIKSQLIPSRSKSTNYNFLLDRTEILEITLLSSQSKTHLFSLLYKVFLTYNDFFQTWSCTVIYYLVHLGTWCSKFRMYKLNVWLNSRGYCSWFKIKIHLKKILYNIFGWFLKIHIYYSIFVEHSVMLSTNNYISMT